MFIPIHIFDFIEGPLYVIMEFAEHGSLITFLRKMRARYPHVQGDIRELISFAWQIAKGMEYLAENKVRSLKYIGHFLI